MRYAYIEIGESALMRAAAYGAMILGCPQLESCCKCLLYYAMSMLNEQILLHSANYIRDI